MTTVFHPLVKRFLDGELRLADLPPALHAEAWWSAPARGRVFVRVVLFAAGARRVSVAGTFTQWDATAAPLALTGAAGVWTATVALPIGQHQYAFLVDGRRWVNDPAAPTVDDGFGRRNSVVAVGAGARAL